jgi:hypothetical protein
VVRHQVTPSMPEVNALEPKAKLKAATPEWETVLAEELKIELGLPPSRDATNIDPSFLLGIQRCFADEIHMVEELSKARADEFARSSVTTPQILILRSMQLQIDANDREIRALRAKEDSDVNIQNKDDAVNPELLFDIQEGVAIDDQEEISNFRNRQKMYSNRLARLEKAERELGEGKWIGYESQLSNVEECMACPGKIKQKSLDFIKHPWFDRFILFVIILNCVTLGLDDPLQQGTPLANFIAMCDFVFMGLFFVEMIVKILALGFVKEENSYLSDPWNILDFIIICSGVLSIVLLFLETEASNANSLRAFRVLRPLRTITQFPGLRVLVNAVLESLTLLGNTMMIMMFFFVVFGIAGLSLFKGSLKYRCYNATSGIMDPRDVEPLRLCGESARQCRTGYDCLKLAENPNSGMVNFDYILPTMLNMFIFVTLEGWSDAMYYLVDAVGELVFIYFIFVIMIGAFILINLTLAVILSSFRQSKLRQGNEREAKMEKFKRRNALQEERRLLLNMQPSQNMKDPEIKSNNWGKLRSAVKMSQALQLENPLKEKKAELSETPIPTQMHLRFWRSVKLCWAKTKVKHKAFKKFILRRKEYGVFEGLIMACIVANSVLMACYYHGMTEAYEDQLKFWNLVFTWVFIVELIIVVVVHNPRAYITDPSKCFDGLLVVFSIVDILLEGSAAGDTLDFLIVFRITRCLRIFRIAKQLKSMNEILAVLGRSISSFGYIAMLLVIFMFIFTVLGMQLFAGKLPDDPRNHCDNFWVCFVTVFQILTGENWNQLIENFLQAHPDTHALFTITYFFGWIFFGQYVLLNLILAVIMEQFGLIEQQSAQKVASADVKGLSRLSRMLKNKAMKSSPLMSRMFSRSESSSPVPGDKPTKKKCISGDKNLLILSKTGSVVKFCASVVTHKWYETIILILIGLSSGVLMFERPEGSEPQQFDEVLIVCDYVFTICFLGEAMLKIIAQGFVFGKDSYLQNGWNMLDFAIVVAGCFLLIMKILVIDVEKFGFLRVLRMMRILRPLRVLSRNRGMQLVVRCLLTSMASIGNVMIVTMIIFFAFAVAGQFLFSGKFWYCSDPTFPPFTHRDGVLNVTGNGYLIEPCSSDFLGADGNPRQWINARFHFDDFLQSFLTLFVLFSLEGWPDILWHGLDVTRVDYSPKKEHSIMSFVFFMFFIMVASFLLLNLFTGVIFESYLEEKRKMDTAGIRMFITPEQQEWIDKCKVYMKMTPPQKRKEPPKKKSKLAIYKLVTSSKFEHFVFLLIGLNLLQQAITWDLEPESWTRASDTINYVFNVMFLIEAGLKIYGLTWAGYWPDNWNKFDFILVVFSVVDMTFSALTNFNFLRVLRIGRIMGRLLRILRVSRVARLAKAFSGLRVIGVTLVASLPALGNITALLCLIFYMYAVAAVKLFGNVVDLEFINSQKNFNSFYGAIRYLFVLSTGESWNEVMRDAMESDSAGAIIFFSTFVVVAQFVMMNLFIMIIVENFDNLNKKKEVGGVEFDNAFKQAWETCDTNNSGKIDFADVDKVLKRLPLPYGLKRTATPAETIRMLTKLDLGVWPGKQIDFTELLLALHRHVRDEAIDTSVLKQLKVHSDDVQGLLLSKSKVKQKSIFGKHSKTPPVDSQALKSVSEEWATATITKYVHKWRDRHNQSKARNSPMEQIQAELGLYSSKSPSDKLAGLKDADEMEGLELSVLNREILYTEKRIGAANLASPSSTRKKKKPPRPDLDVS